MKTLPTAGVQDPHLSAFSCSLNHEAPRAHYLLNHRQPDTKNITFDKQSSYCHENDACLRAKLWQRKRAAAAAAQRQLFRTLPPEQLVWKNCGRRAGEWGELVTGAKTRKPYGKLER